MKLDSRDIKLLRLAGKYRWLPFGGLDTFGFPELTETTEVLLNNGYLTLSRNKLYTKPSPKGYEYLESLGYIHDATTKRAYANSIRLRRRLEASRIMLTCLRAGIDTLRDDVDDLAFVRS